MHVSPTLLRKAKQGGIHRYHGLCPWYSITSMPAESLGISFLTPSQILQSIPQLINNSSIVFINLL